MNYPVLIIFVVLIFGLNTAYGLPPPPPTNFVVTITDESNQPVLPVSLQITEILDGETLLSYGIDLFENPQTVIVKCPSFWHIVPLSYYSRHKSTHTLNPCTTC